MRKMTASISRNYLFLFCVFVVFVTCFLSFFSLPKNNVRAQTPSTAPTGQEKSCQLGGPNSAEWEKLNEYDEFFIAAAEEFAFDANILKAMAMIESDGQGHFAPDGSVLTGCDQYGGGCAKGIMQIKPAIWYDPKDSIGRQIGADPLLPEGNIRLAAKLMADWTRETGSWENAITQKYHPGTGQHGLTQGGYVTTVKGYLEKELGGAECAQTSGDPSRTPANPAFGKSTCVVTKVGSPSVSPILPAGCTGSGGGVPGQPFPEGDILVVKDRLCDQYKVCVTMNQEESPASSDWSMEQLRALWNVVQRIYESPTYTKLAIGNYELEMQRSACIPSSCGAWWGAYLGLTLPSWNTRPNARLITITDGAARDAQSQVIFEWLLAHEIGHSASGGNIDGGLTPELGMNEPYRRVAECNETVSGYGGTNTNENNSEIIAFFMTAAEEATVDYFGQADNLAEDFPCTYRAAKEYYFDGKEF